MSQQPVELILMRQLASHLTMPVWIAGVDGRLLYYNEAAAPLIGRAYDATGEIQVDDLTGMFDITTDDGSPLPPEALPLGIALRERKPAHLPMRYRGLDGVARRIEVTAFPLESQGGRHVGAVAIFWETNGA